VTPREQLLDLANDVDRLLAAGVTAGSGDALRRRGKVLHELGKKVPALVPVADAVERVAGADKPGPAFLDLLVLARQVRASLAPADADGPLTPLAESGPWQTPLAVRDVRTLHAALTGTGPVLAVTDACDRGLLTDLRLVTTLLAALVDPHAPWGDALAERAVPALGRGVLDELRADLNLKGKVGDARRLSAVCRIDAEAGADLCRRALAGGSAAVRAGALKCLPEVVGADEAERTGLKYLGDKNRDVRCAAILSLRLSESEEALEALLGAFDVGDEDMNYAAEASLGTFRHPQTTARIVRELREILPQLRKGGAAKSGAGKKAISGPAAQTRQADLACQAAWLIGALGHRKDGDLRTAAETILPFFTEQLDFASKAAYALAALGPVSEKIVPAVAGVLAAKGSAPKYAAITILEGFPPAAREAAVPALADFVVNAGPSHAARFPAFALLADHADRHAEKFLRAARALSTDQALWYEDGLREYLTTVGKAGPRAKPLLPYLFKAFKNVMEDVPMPLGDWLRVIARIDPGGGASIPELIKMLGSRNPEARLIALEILEVYGPKARKASATVERLAGDRDRRTRVRAEQTLGAIR
jgi:hypothetical protein